MELDFSDITTFIATHRDWAVLLIFLVSFGESFAFVSLVVPGTTILAACGALVPGGTLSIWPLLAGAIPGAVLGDGVSYWLGRRYGPALTQCWPLKRHPEMVTRGEAFLNRYGTASVALGRFLGPVRAVIPLVAGMARMDRRAFWIANVASAVVWAPVVMLPGAALGWLAQVADARVWWLVAAAAAVVGLGVCWLVRRRGASVCRRRGAGV